MSPLLAVFALAAAQTPAKVDDALTSQLLARYQSYGLPLPPPSAPFVMIGSGNPRDTTFAFLLSPPEQKLVELQMGTVRTPGPTQLRSYSVPARSAVCNLILRLPSLMEPWPPKSKRYRDGLEVFRQINSFNTLQIREGIAEYLEYSSTAVLDPYHYKIWAVTSFVMAIPTAKANDALAESSKSWPWVVQRGELELRGYNDWVSRTPYYPLKDFDDLFCRYGRR